MASMRLHLRSLVLAMLSFLLGLRALEIGSELDLRSREIRHSQRQATCTYTTSHIIKPPTSRISYIISINLPRSQWKTACLQGIIMQPILESIKLRCIQKWSGKDSLRRFEGPLDAALKNGQCRIRIKITTELEDNQMSSRFEDDCILESKPELCGLATESVLWPSMCFGIEVGISHILLAVSHRFSDRCTKNS